MGFDRVLIVDDEYGVRKLLSSILTEFRVQSVDCVEEAIKIISRSECDVVVSDIKMPKHSGLELLNIVKKLKVDIPVIMITGHGNKQNVIESIRGGAYDFLEKPFEEEELVHTVKRALETSRVKLEKDQIQSQLIQSAKLASIGILASGVAHELNNPLTVVMGNTQLIKKLKDDPAKIDEKVDKINHAAVRMKSIIDHLRTFSRESRLSERQQFEILEPINYVLGFLRKQLELQEITINLSMTNSQALVNGDIVQFESVFQNLLINSRDAFDEIKDNRKKQITIKTLVEDDNLKIIFQDNATGIPKNIQDSIFDPFFTTKETGRGTGLGLSIARNIIEDHKGTMLVESEDGKGTIFLIKIPLAKNVTNVKELGKVKKVKKQNESVLSGASQTSNTAKTGASCSYKNFEDNSVTNITIVDNSNNGNSDNKSSADISSKVLIIDDETDVLEIVSQSIERSFDVRTAIDPYEALKTIENQKFDLILTDLKMPKVSGIDILAHSKKCQPETPVIIMSGFSKYDEDIQYALSQGAKGYFSKPFEDANKLINSIQSYIDS